MARAKAKRKQEIPDYIGTDTVDNPYDVGPAKIIALRSYRDDPLALMLARNQLGDGRTAEDRKRNGMARYAAGRAYQRMRHAAEVSPVQAMDPTKEPVDGGGNVMRGLADRKLDAVERMNQLRNKLGHRDVAMLDHILIANMGIREYAHATGWHTAKHVNAVAWQFRQALELLAEEFGYA